MQNGRDNLIYDFEVWATTHSHLVWSGEQQPQSEDLISVSPSEVVDRFLNEHPSDRPHEKQLLQHANGLEPHRLKMKRNRWEMIRAMQEIRMRQAEEFLA